MTRKTITHSLIFVSYTFATLLPATAQECSNEDFQGRYSFEALIFNLAAGNLPESAAGTLVADGSGLVLEWKDTFVRATPDGMSTTTFPRDVVAAAAAAGNNVTYEVTADCTTTIRADIGVVVIELNGGLAHGGRELLAHQIAPAGFVGPGIFKSVEPSAADALPQLKALIDRVAVRLGLRP